MIQVINYHFIESHACTFSAHFRWQDMHDGSDKTVKFIIAVFFSSSDRDRDFKHGICLYIKKNTIFAP